MGAGEWKRKKEKEETHTNKTRKEKKKHTHTHTHGGGGGGVGGGGVYKENTFRRSNARMQTLQTARPANTEPDRSTRLDIILSDFHRDASVVGVNKINLIPPFIA